MNDEFEMLWQEFLDGGLGQEGFARLDALLRNDPALARHAADRYEEHRLLGLVLRAEPGDRFATAVLARVQADRDDFSARLRASLGETATPALTGRVARWRRRWGIAAAAAAAMAAVLLTARTFGPAAIEPVATLLRSEATEWVVPRVEGERLAPGLLELQTGSALLRFDSGAMLVLTAPAALRLETRGRAVLVRGALAVRTPDEASGLVVRTPAGDFTDRGAEFAAEVDATGATRAEVRAGEVAFAAAGRARTETRRVPPGTMIRIDAAGVIAAQAEVREEASFAALLRAMERRPRAAQPEVYEGFDYPAGETRPEAMSGGSGWRGPWRARTSEERQHFEDTMPGPVVAAISLVRAGAGRAAGGALEFAAGQNSRVRALAQGIDLGRDGVIYLSALVRREPGVVAPDPAQPLDAIRITLRASQDYWGPSVSLALRPGQQPQIGCGPGVTFNSPQSFPAGETLLLAGKIVARAKGEDEIFLRVFAAGERIDPWEPAEWTVGTRGIAISAVLDRVLLTGSGAERCQVDELRIGATWAAAVPSALLVAGGGGPGSASPVRSLPPKS